MSDVLRRNILLISVMLVLCAWTIYRTVLKSADGKIQIDYQLPHDNFNQSTMIQIQSSFNQDNVSQTPQDHEVYVLTGGLGTANPRIMGSDSNGDMDFSLQSKPVMFKLSQMAESPSTWQMEKDQKGGILVSDGPSSGMTPVPWAKEVTASGRVYYKWDEFSGITQFYFREGNTYIILVVNGENGNYPFPAGIMNHLEPIGNPVTSSNK